MSKLEQIIQGNPGITQNGIVKLAGMKKARLLKLLQEGIPTRWSTKNGSHGSICYLPFGNKDLQTIPENHSPLVPAVPAFGNKDLPSTGNKTTPNGAVLVPLFPPSKRGTGEQVSDGAQERLCAKHGFHSNWAFIDGAYLCGKCGPAHQPARGQKMAGG
jgi:hypothetical protein